VWDAQPFFLDNGSDLACSATVDYRHGTAAGVPVTIYAIRLVISPASLRRAETTKTGGAVIN